MGYGRPSTGRCRTNAISRIDTYAAWPNTGRFQQDYKIAFAFANAPSTFFDVFTVVSPNLFNKDFANCQAMGNSYAKEGK